MGATLVGAAEKDPARAVRSFYNWYVRELVKGARPLETERDQMRQFVTENLLAQIGHTRKGPGGLDGDPFLNAQEIDPDWGKNIAVGNYWVGKTMARLGVIVTGRRLGDREVRLKMVMENGKWKIDEVKLPR